MLKFLYLHPVQLWLFSILATVLLSFTPLPFFVPYCFLFLLLLLLLFLFSYMNKSVAKAFYTDCDPEPYLELNLNNIRRFQKSPFISSQKNLSAARLNVANALDALGRYEEALSLLNTVAPETLPSNFQCYFWITRFNILFHMESTDLADLSFLLSQAQMALDRFPLPQQEQALTTLYSDRLALRARQEGTNEDIEAQFSQLLSEAENELYRVSHHMTLAQCALSRNDPAAAREHLEYVVAHGNKLHTRAKAQELLSTLP